jgi:hypothetical protein
LFQQKSGIDADENDDQFSHPIEHKMFPTGSGAMRKIAHPFARLLNTENHDATNSFTVARRRAAFQILGQAFETDRNLSED